jgi:hypothetical protein
MTRIECAFNEHGACSFNGKIRGFNNCSCSCHEREGECAYCESGIAEIHNHEREVK